MPDGLLFMIPPILLMRLKLLRAPPMISIVPPELLIMPELLKVPREIISEDGSFSCIG